MKKLWSFIFLLCFVSLPFISYKNKCSLFIENNFVVECYYNFYNSQFPECETIKNGQGSIVLTNNYYYQKNKSKFDYGLNGITFITDDNNISINKLKQDMCLKELNISSEENLYGFSKYFSNCINLQNKKVNTQILLKDGKIYIGSPILLGSY